MKQNIGVSISGNLLEAVKYLPQNPDLLFLMTNKKQFNEHVSMLEEKYPHVPSLGFICTSYSDHTTIDQGVTIISFSDTQAVATNVIPELSSMPVRHIFRMEEDLKNINATSNNTVCIDFSTTTADDSKLMTTLGSVLERKGISLIGGSVAENQVSCNGIIYEDACIYALIKNKGNIITYKEIIYEPTSLKAVVTKSDAEQRIIYELNNQPAQSVYCNYLNVSPNQISTQTFQNPLGKWVGNEFNVVAINAHENDGLLCYKHINNTDILSVLKLGDYQHIIDQTIANIQSSLHSVSGIFTMNCAYRFALFNQDQYWNEYLDKMNFSTNHVGLVALGEHFDFQHVTQTMVCMAFE